jgi:hypothetical protein
MSLELLANDALKRIQEKMDQILTIMANGQIGAVDNSDATVQQYRALTGQLAGLRTAQEEIKLAYRALVAPEDKTIKVQTAADNDLIEKQRNN